MYWGACAFTFDNQIALLVKRHIDSAVYSHNLYELSLLHANNFLTAGLVALCSTVCMYVVFRIMLKLSHVGTIYNNQCISDFPKVT